VQDVGTNVLGPNAGPRSAIAFATAEMPGASEPLTHARIELVDVIQIFCVDLSPEMPRQHCCPPADVRQLLRVLLTRAK